MIFDRKRKAAARLNGRKIGACLGAVALAASFSALADAPKMASYSTPGWDTKFFMKEQQPFKIASLSLQLKSASKVLVQFSSELSSEHATGCPCNVRALVSMDGGKPRPLKRINVGTPAAHDVDKYDNDRQNLDATTVFDAPAGKHTFELTFQQVDTKGDNLQIYYPNFQAIAFPD